MVCVNEKGNQETVRQTLVNEKEYATENVCMTTQPIISHNIQLNNRF